MPDWQMSHHVPRQMPHDRAICAWTGEDGSRKPARTPGKSFSNACAESRARTRVRIARVSILYPYWLDTCTFHCGLLRV